jgi:hypothetical protein
MPGATPIFGFPYPDPSDLVANYPALGQQLAEDVEDAIYARKILQVVRATDSTDRTTTSASYVDVTGMSVTITPQKSDSAIFVIASFNAGPDGATYIDTQITDSSNNALSGAEQRRTGNNSNLFRNGELLLGYSTPATTSAVTYKLRFRTLTSGQNVKIENNSNTGQMYAIEVSA